MKRFLSYILILVVILQLFAPFSVGTNSKGRFAISANTAEAGLYNDNNKKWADDLDGFKNAFSSSFLSVNGTSTSPETKKSTIDFHIRLDTGLPENTDATDVWNRTRIGFGEEIFVLVIKDKDGKSGYYDLKQELLEIPPCKSCSKKDKKIAEIWGNESLPVAIETDFSVSGNNISPIGTEGLSELVANSTYTATLYYYSNQGGILYSTSATNNGENVLGNNNYVYFPIKETGINTATTEQNITGKTGTGNTSVTQGATSQLPVCSIMPYNFKLGGCIAQGMYFLFFKTTSFIFGLAGKIMDFTMMYSVSDSSYRSNFVAEGWQVTRDICNMFFIFVLLYIAFKTILGIDGSKTKSLIINVVAVGLMINFSLFATQVVIDASNILARVFYNQKTIITGPKDSSGKVTSELGSFGEIKLSEAIVTKVDPQKLIIQASEVGKISTNSGVNGEDSDNLSAGNFIIVTLLATAVNIVGLVVFLSIAFALVGRVITLWIAMILAPIAFFSYTVPELRKQPMIGANHWWGDLISAAFMAPVFAFFMYIIVGFMDKGLGLNDILDKKVEGLGFVVSIAIPFILIMVLLNKAKSISVKMSGQAGQMLAGVGSSIGGKVAGLGLTAVTGGAALAMRSTLGRAGASIANSEKLKEMEAKGGIRGFGAKTLRNIGSSTGKAGFDFRNTKLGATANSAMGKELGIDMGKGKTGGFTKAREEQIEKANKRAKDLEIGNMSKAKEELRKKEQGLQILQNASGPDIEKAEKDIEGARKALADAESIYNFEKTDENKEEVRKKQQELKDHKKKLFDLKNGTITGKDGKYLTDNGNISEKGYQNAKEKAEKDKKAEGEAILNTSRTEIEAGESERKAIESAGKEKKEAIKKAEEAELKAIEDAGKAKLEAIKKAEEAVIQASSAYSMAIIAEKSNPTAETKEHSRLAKENHEKAQFNLSNTKITSDQSYGEASKKAENSKKEAIKKAEEAELKAIEDAGKAKEKAITEAKEKEDVAVKKSTESQASFNIASESYNKGPGKSIKDITDEITKAKRDITDQNNERRNNFAKSTESTSSKAFNVIFSGGQYSPSGANEAAHKIRTDNK